MKTATCSLSFVSIVSAIMALQTGCMQTKPVVTQKSPAPAPQETASQRTADSLIGNF